MDYRMQTQPMDAAKSALKGMAIQQERVAFSHEVDLQRMNALFGDKPTKEQQEQIKERTESAANERARAERKVKRAELTDDEVNSVRVEHLRGWITALENDHISHVAVGKALKEDVKDKTLSEEEREATEKEVETRREQIRDIETAHEIACDMLDGLVPPEDNEDEEGA